MRFPILTCTLLLLSSYCLANGRSPAVEDFVGIEVEEPKADSQGSETLFNLEKDISRIETVRKDGTVEAMTPTVPATPARPWGASAYFGLAFILGLPLLTWTLLMQHLRRKAREENAANIEVLEKFRREKELARKQDQEIRKVS